MSDTRSQSTVLFVQHLLRFARRVVGRFWANHGILLAGGVGYNVLLSAIPLAALLGVVLSHIVPEAKLLEVISFQARLLGTGQSALLVEAVKTFLNSREVVGFISVPVMLFFSSFAFRMMEDAIAIIFHRPDAPSRSFWVSAVLPFAFILVLGIGLLSLTLVVIFADLFYDRPGTVLYPLSFLCMFVLFSAIYKVLPIVRIKPSRAIIGGFVAALLWEGTRLVLMYYLQNVSFVNVIYGSLTTSIIILITLEVGAIILLLGAQVIAELEDSAYAGLPWYQGARLREQKNVPGAPRRRAEDRVQ
ncbi:MAG: Ribonuclease BN [Marinobacter sp. T13-3]|jgi:YihY family inner membrane protein|nr:MAG: Ribonuclease BN [Marinobacter sp. T13-3]